MKILKKDKQQMFTGLLKHTPPPASAAAASSSASDQNSNAQTTVPTIPRGHLVVGPKDQLRLLTPVGSTATSNHCVAAGVHATKHGVPRPPSSLSEEDDGGGGGRVKKKRKKKDKKEWEKAGEGEEKESSKPKKRKEEKVPTVTLRKSKEPKEGKERRGKGKEGRKDSRAELKAKTAGVTSGAAQVPIKVPGKRGRKPKIKVLPPLPTNQAAPPTQGVHGKVQLQGGHGKNHNQANSKAPAPSAPKQRGRKPRDPGAVPVEKKKKGKRRNQELAVQEGAESDDTTSMSALHMGGEDSQDPLDNAKRRSGRQVKRRKYNEDLDFKVVDDDGETIAVLGAGRISALNATALAWQAEEPPEDEANIIEKILSVRTVKKETSSSEDQAEDTEEFYVKYRNFSYLHCKWATLEELEKDPRIHQKIKRFRTKQAQMKHLFTEPDEDLFNPDYVEVDRVLEVAVTTDTETGEEVTHYLVKWCSLSYEEATWELQEDLDPEKIKEFEEIQKLPADLRHMERPPPDKWQKLEHSRDYRNGNQLREYQLEGMNWLLFNWYNRKNCILADEMGLGKTIQSITFLYEIFSMGIRGPFLIIAPLSTITNWEREFRTWTHMNVIVYHGSQISRQMILQYEMFHRDPQGNTIPGVLKFHGVITTFEMIMADCPELKKLHWRCVVIDEAHRLKNRNCKLLEGLKLMNLEHKVLLTGTPLQNSVEELFSLLNFLEPLQFPSESAFLEEFGDLKTDEQVKKLQAILKPMMLRRLKDDVEKNLAPKEETIIEVELTNIQKKYYRAILEKNFSFLSKGANQHNMPNLINTMMELRKCCNHPYLITGAEEKILESFKKCHSPDAPDFQLQAMIQAAGKLVLIDKLLPKLLAGGHKVLVFSQMVRCLDILEDYLIQRRYTYERIDGRVRGNLRQAAIDRFCKPDSDRFVFLLCTRAGGLGINLTAADTCIIFDSDWNPQNDLQAQARCHRIGQSKAVKVYRLITRNSYEREMFDKASLKLGLDKAVLQDINRKGSLNGVQQLSKLEVEDLLKKGAYGALMDEEDEGSKFCEEDIDQILQRRTQTITIQSEGKGSTFAKASFISSGNRTDISLDDPNFWQKWAKIAEVEIDSKSEKESLVIDTPRVRKQTRHYNSFEDDELMEFSELDSDSEERPCRTRRLGERSRRYLRAECFRVEKNLLIFGWGRWKDILNHGRFKWHLAERDMEVICRALLVYCLRHYKGDDKIKSFIWDLIAPTKEGQDQALLNHSGLSAPVPRGRKGKKLKNQLNVPEVKNADWLVHCNPEVVLQDESYKKHLKQHCNKVLLRVRMLYYLKVEVLGEAANQAAEGIPASKLEVSLPDIDYIEIPVTWWDADADKSLLIGVHKHGYERYNAMRADPDLCFLERVGMPDVTALTAEQGGGEVASDMADRYSTDARPLWPTGPALTARLRRLITAYQRFTLRREPLLSCTVSNIFCLLLTSCVRWTRREQADFYRTVSSFGVIYDPERKTFDWSQFRALARLERKTDESLERYFNSFVNMCRTACKLPPRKEEGLVDPAVLVEPLTEERAARTLYRIELLRKIREQVLRHPLLSARLQLCRPSLYLPVWWESGKHDRDLLIGAARHGLSRTDFYILNDPQLSFLEAHRNYVRGHPAHLHPQSHHHPHHPGLATHSGMSSSSSSSSHPQLPHPHCCLYDSGLSHHSPQLRNNLCGTWSTFCHSLKLFSFRTGCATNAENTATSGSAVIKPAGFSGRSDPQSSARLRHSVSVQTDDNSFHSADCDRYMSKTAKAESTILWCSSIVCTSKTLSHNLHTITLLSKLPSESLKKNKRIVRFSNLRWCVSHLQDRVIISRLDSICHAILKGKWPSSSEQYDSPASLAANSCLANSLAQHHQQRAGFLPTTASSSVSGENLSPAQHLEMLKLFLCVDVCVRVQGRVEVISHSSVSSSTSSPSPSPSERPAGPPTPSSSSTPTPTQTPPQPEIVAIDREAASKGLIEWLRQNPGYSMDLPAFAHVSLLHGFVDRPKQRRHRCKDPTKLDINSLTGEERVPVVHRGTGRRLGGAMAPAIKELSRWLDANSEYYVAPDWADVVKHSGFLPEGKFSRILTEPVNRDPGSRRRGRRPRSEMPKPLLSVSDSSSSGLGPPLFMNGGLIGSMDSMVAMQNLRGGIPGIPISGIMAAGFPHGFSAAVTAGAAGASAEDAKNGLSMLPMMLHGIPHPHGAAIPQHALFSVGTMMAHTAPPPPPQPASSSSTTASPSSSAAKVTTTTAPSTSEAASPSSTTPAERDNAASSAADKEKGTADGNKRVEAAAAAIITSTSRAHISSAHLGGTGSHLTFNPFLIPGMSHGLLYPHMFLPHGGIMALPAMPPGAVDGSPGSPRRRRKRGREEGEREEEKAAVAAGEESTVKESSPPSVASTSDPPPTEELQGGEGPSEQQEPDSNDHSEGVAAAAMVENEETSEEVREENTEEQRQAEEEA
uniref:DNA helicase n=1 Tax=Amphiprion ocellaris TaxID=80972 RepID=A0AAQ5YT22_AMPOC